MFLNEVSKRFCSAKNAGRRYLLVCFDTFDRLRGDKDLGYYYQEFDDAEAVRSRLSDVQIDEWNPSDLRDCCVAVIDVAKSSEFSERLCENPAHWLDQNLDK